MANRILIVGASGFIGGYLTKYALENGFQTYAGIRSSSSKKYLTDPRIRFCYFDYDNIEAIAEVLQKNKFQYIIYNIGLTKARTKEAYFKVNNTYLRNFVLAIKKSKIEIKKFIFISSLAAYGPAEYSLTGIVKEHEKPHPVTSYGTSKLAAEQYLKSELSIPFNIIRPTAVYGPREQDFLLVYKLVNKHLELIIGYQKQELTFIYIHDLVSAIFEVMNNAEIHKNYFIADEKSYDSEELHRIIKNCLKKKTLKIKLPIFFVGLLATVTEAISKISNSYPALNKEKVKELKCQSWRCDVVPLKEDFNFVPRFDLKQGMAATIQWNKENGLL